MSERLDFDNQITKNEKEAKEHMLEMMMAARQQILLRKSMRKSEVEKYQKGLNYER